VSIRLLTRAWELELPAARKLVLLCLADHASDDERKCWPSVARIATRTGLTERAVQQHLAGLKEGGLVKVHASSMKGRGRATVYVVLPEDTGLSTARGVKSVDSHEKGEPGAPINPERVHEEAQKGERHAPQSVEPSRESSRTRVRAREVEPAAPAESRLNHPAAPPEHIGDVLARLGVPGYQPRAAAEGAQPDHPAEREKRTDQADE
jgi:DNA-binding transcriptional ArsR family regulator